MVDFEKLNNQQAAIDSLVADVAEQLQTAGVSLEVARKLQPSPDVTGKLKLEMTEQLTGDDYALIDTFLKTKYGAKYEAGSPDGRSRSFWLLTVPVEADVPGSLIEGTQTLAKYVVNGSTLTVSPVLTFHAGNAPFQNFFIEKVVTKIQDKDRELVRLGQLSTDKIFAYSVVKTDDVIQALTFKNVSEERVKEITVALRWTLAKMLEKESTPAAPAVETKTPTGTNSSPANVFKKRFCDGCEDKTICGPVEAKNCLEIMHLFEVQRQTDELSKLNKFLTTTQFKPASQLQQPAPAQTPAQPPAQSRTASAPAQSLRTVADVKKLIPPIITESLKPFEETSDQIILRTKQKLGTDQFKDLKDIVKGMGGDYISAGADSRFWIPKRRA